MLGSRAAFSRSQTVTLSKSLAITVATIEILASSSAPVFISECLYPPLSHTSHLLIRYYSATEGSTNRSSKGSERLGFALY
jgi:hypothetical protein